MYILPALTLFVIGCNAWPLTDIAENLLKDVGNTTALRKFSLIYPGTKWCGPGNSAENYDDLGEDSQADACCRDHDNCPDLVAGLHSNHGLTNTAFYTRLNCTCDEKFRQCLHSAKNNQTVAKTVGTIYFDVLGTQCFREDYPIVKCEERGGLLGTKCLKYAYNTTAEKKYQWFDVPSY